MVHRIQNRNPGYSDFSNTGNAQAFNFSNSVSSSAISGANALKLENEVLTENSPEVSSSEIMNEGNETNQELEVENVLEDSSLNVEEESFTKEALSDLDENKEPSNGLENFGFEEETPELFNNEEESTIKELSEAENDENSSDDDDLEIPAFLRRQKN